MSRPEVSVCMPVYQAERHVASAIESVLRQTFHDWELVIVDNSSTDGTAEVLSRYDDPRIVITRNDVTVGLADNWNLAVQRARGRFIKVLPADDILYPECLELQVKEHDAHPGIALVACRRDFIDDNGEVVLRSRGVRRLSGEHPSAHVVNRIMASGVNPIGDPAAMLFRRDHFLTAGEFDASLPFPMDLELSVRLLEHGTFFGQSHTLSAFRVHPGSISAATLSDQVWEHRTLLRRIAANEQWDISRTLLWRGLARTRIEGLKRRLLFTAVATNSSFVRRLPSVMLDDASKTAL
ncbi:MAG: glycosyltransferase [Actinomycetota bacterium]